VAREIDPSNVASAAVAAARSILARRRRLLETRSSFCLETTLATKSLMHFIEEAKRAGYSVELVFLFTPFAHVNEMRVKQRVMAGGHNIDTDTTRRRHRLGLRYLGSYWRAVSEAVVLDARTPAPMTIVRKDAQTTCVIDRSRHSLLLQCVRDAGGDPAALA
jgi:predicted ABC-type ATPase